MIEIILEINGHCLEVNSVVVTDKIVATLTPKLFQIFISSLTTAITINIKTLLGLFFYCVLCEWEERVRGFIKETVDRFLKRQDV